MQVHLLLREFFSLHNKMLMIFVENYYSSQKKNLVSPNVRAFYMNIDMSDACIQFHNIGQIKDKAC